MKRKLKRYTRQLKEGKITLPEIQRSIAGWLGYVKHADSYNLRKSMFYIGIDFKKAFVSCYPWWQLQQ